VPVELFRDKAVMGILDQVLTRPEFDAVPPVLVDVGASGGLHSAWEHLAKYSVCVAFDADDREMRADSRIGKVYRKLYIYNRALTAGSEGVADFFLTKAPACSSMLPPHTEKLAAWEFADRFTVVRKGTVETIHLQTVLRELKIEQVDWIKIDSQGTDLRLFQSLGEQRARRVLVAEFEPAIMDSYQGEDKLWQLMSAMDRLNFWMCESEIKGSQRIRKSLMDAFRPFERKYMVHLLKSAPGWAEVAYLNGFADDGLRLREYLLGWVCATVKGHHGFALELAIKAKERFREAFCEELEQNSVRSIRRRYWDLPAYFPLVSRVYHRWRKEKRHQNVPAALAAVQPASGAPVVRGDARD
jgi:FkbM family methyltransferase